MPKLIRENVRTGVKFEGAPQEDANRLYPKRHAGCISGCSMGTNGRFLHHPYCMGPTWGNWEARYNNLVTDLNLAADAVIELVIFQEKFDDVDKEELARLVAITKQARHDLDAHLAVKPSKMGPLL